MRAVNLIPADKRKRGSSISTGGPFMALTGGLVIVLIAVTMLVLAHDRVASRKSQLASVQAQTAKWSGVTGTYSQDLATNKQRQATIDGIETLVGQRANWSELLEQLAGVMPSRSRLSSLNASAASSASTASASTAAATATGGTSSGSSIQISACAASQTVVAETLIALRRITGVSQVSLGASSQSDGSGSSSGSGGSSSGCGYPVSFSVTLAFTPPTFSAGPAAEVPARDSSATTIGGTQ